MIIEAIKPKGIYLSPNLAERPGVMVAKVKIVKLGPRQYKTYYYKDRAGWEEFIANDDKI